MAKKTPKPGDCVWVNSDRYPPPGREGRIFEIDEDGHPERPFRVVFVFSVGTRKVFFSSEELDFLKDCPESWPIGPDFKRQ